MKTISYVLVFILGLGSGLYIGFKYSPIEYMYYESQFKASLLAFELESIKNGKSLSEIKEIQLNGELANHGRYLESPYSWLYQYIEGEEFNPKYITHAVEYRLKNPYAEPDLSDPKNRKPDIDINDPTLQFIIEGQKENQAFREKVVNLYGTK